LWGSETPDTSQFKVEVFESSTGESKTSTSSTFTRVTGTSYTAVATTKGARKTLKCTTAKTKVTCATKGLKRGQWKLIVTPSIKKVKGTPFVKTVRIK
jgi:hypothetical protein